MSNIPKEKEAAEEIKWHGVIPPELYDHFHLSVSGNYSISADVIKFPDGSYAATFWWVNGRTHLVDDGRRETYGDPNVNEDKRTVNEFRTTDRLTSALPKLGLTAELKPIEQKTS